MLVITPMIKVRFSEFKLTYARSSGPGGQNVNKVNSKAILHWNILESQSFTESIKAHLLGRLASQITLEGEIVITSDRFRDQTRNREDCIEKLRILLTEAAKIPKIRMKTKPSRSSQRRVKEAKNRQSEKKTLRRSLKFHE